MSNNWEVIVGNVGNVWSGTNGYQAIRQFQAWVTTSKGTVGFRASGEPVTLMKNGEPYREFDPDAGWFYIEETDTFGGEANYSWVHRYKVKANTPVGALRKAGLSGMRFDYESSDEYGTRRYNRQKACICAFVSHYSTEANGNALHVKVIE